MDEFLFGLTKRKKSSVRRKTTPVRRKTTPVRRKTTPVRRKTTPVRRKRTVMCSKKLSLPKLRKLALENGINIYSERKTALNKRTGKPKKPKLVGCSTLKKGLKDAGLEHLYKTRVVVEHEDPMNIFMEGIPHMQDDGVLVPDAPLVFPDMDAFNLDDEMLDVTPVLSPNMHPPDALRFITDVDKLDSACAKKFDEYIDQVFPATMANAGEKRARAKKLLLGFAKGDTPCGDQRRIVNAQGVDDPASLLASFGTERASARPRQHFKHVGNIVVKGRSGPRSHFVFRGPNGGLFYLKGKSGKKVYIDPKKLKKRK